MKILALNPKDFYAGWPVQSDFGRELYRCPALTFPVLKRLLPAGHEMRLFDGFFEPQPMRHYLELIRWPDLVAVNIASAYGALSYAIAIKQIKRLNPQARIIAGGHHAYLFRKRWLELGVDVIATGEGETMFHSLIEQISGGGHFDQVPGVAFKSGGQYVETAPAPQIESLDESPEPDLDLINFSIYPNYLSPGGGWVGSLESSRGCIFKCKFCTTPVYWRGTQRYKSFGRVAKEIEALLGRGVRQINILDDGFGNDLDYTRELLKVFARYRDRMTWGSFIRADSALKDPGLIEQAGQSGMRMAIVGFESVDEEVLKECIGKGMRVPLNLRELQEVYHGFQKQKILVIGTFISGHPGMGPTSRASYLEARKVCDDPRLADYMPFPGTLGYDKLAEQFPIKDMFFHDVKLPIFPERSVEAFRFNLLNILDLPRSLRLLFRGYNYRWYLLNSHRYLWKKMLRLNRRKLRDYFMMRRNDLSSDQKQGLLFKWYLDDPNYQQWLDAQDERVWF